MVRRTASILAAVLIGMVLATSQAAADGAQGTIRYQSKSGLIVVSLTHVYLVKGPDAVTDKIVRRLVFSPIDLAPKLRTCGTMMCGDGDMAEGLTIDLDAGRRLNYWFVANGQRVQYSGTAEMATLALTTNTPQRLAGTWDLDDSAAGGPRAQILFDASLLKVFTKAH